jgi:hypothetical protein
MSDQQIDWSKAAEFEKHLEEISAEKLKRVRVFDPKDVVRKAKAIREVYDEDLGTIRYVLLSYADLNEIMEKYPNNRDRSVQLLFKQLVPANKGLTADDIRAMPYEVVVRLLMKLQGEGSFFPPKPTSTSKPSKNGSALTR